MSSDIEILSPTQIVEDINDSELNFDSIMIEEDMRIQPSRVAKSNIKRLRIVDYSV
jgi:hypothetical protein